MNNHTAVVLSYSDLYEICDFYDVSPGEISENPCYADYIADHHILLRQLIDGYAEMGSINREICDDFCTCDTDLTLVV